MFIPVLLLYLSLLRKFYPPDGVCIAIGNCWFVVVWVVACLAVILDSGSSSIASGGVSSLSTFYSGIAPFHSYRGSVVRGVTGAVIRLYYISPGGSKRLTEQVFSIVESSVYVVPYFLRLMLWLSLLPWYLPRPFLLLSPSPVCLQY